MALRSTAKSKSRPRKPAAQAVTLTLSSAEATQLLEVLKHTEGMGSMLDPKVQGFLGKLIKKIGKGAGRV